MDEVEIWELPFQRVGKGERLYDDCNPERIVEKQVKTEIKDEEQKGTCLCSYGRTKQIYFDYIF